MTDTDKANALDWLNEIVTNPYMWRMFYSDGETKSCAKATLELLKEHEAVTPVLDKQTGRIWLCGNCRSYVGFEDNDPHDPNEYDKYCRECGRPVLWEGR